MKKRDFLLGCFTFITGISVNAQIIHQNSPNHLSTESLMSKKLMDNTDHVNMNMSIKNYGPISSQSKIYENGIVEEIIGESYYDLQTNNSIQNRLFVHDDNTVSAAWIMSPEQGAGFPKRGTGYNYYNGTSWLPLPTSRIESDRTGWPSISGLNNGEIIASHVIGNNQATIDGQTTLYSRTNKGEGSWSENSELNSSEEIQYDNLWPRMKVGGPDGQSIHLISHTHNLNNNYVSYSRSLDAGETWDIVNYILPEIGPEFYMGFDGDAYAMDVRGETVAFVIGGAWTDVVLMKSMDNGTSWTKTIVYEHPIPMFDDSIIVNDTIENSDQSFSISIDNNGNAHIFFGLMKYTNNTANDESWSYFPSSNGLIYWNEITQTNTVITSVIDENEDGVINIETIDNLAAYETSLTSFPSSTIADNGDIYLTYSGVIEYLYPLQSEIGNGGSENYLQHYRHQYIMRSQDGGQTWSEPYDLMAEITNPETGDPLQEGVFGCIANVVDDFVYLTYQRDHLPGLNIRGDEDPITNNQIVFLKITVDEFDDLANLSTKELVESDEDFYVYPNPSDNMINIRLDNNQKETAINIVNIIGETVLSTKMTNSETQLSIEALTSGVYFISVETPTNRMIKSLVKK